MGKYQCGTEALTGRKLKVIVERRQHFWRDRIEIQVCEHPLVFNTGDTIKLQSRRRQKRGKAEPTPLQIGGRINGDTDSVCQAKLMLVAQPFRCAFLVNLCLHSITYFSISLFQLPLNCFFFFSISTPWKLNSLPPNTLLVQSLYRHIRSEWNYTDARRKTCIKNFPF